MDTLTLKAQMRTLKGRKTWRIRAEGQVPAVVYGTGMEPKMVAVDRNEFVKVYKSGGESTLVDLEIEGVGTIPVLFQDHQQNPLTDEVTHIDFRAVDLTKKVEAEVRLEFVGESSAVKALGGTLVHVLEEVEVSALPKNLPSEIEVDLSMLKTFEDVIRISDLVVPEGVEILAAKDESVAVVTPPRSDAEMAGLDEAVDVNVATIEKVTKKPAAEEVAE